MQTLQQLQSGALKGSKQLTLSCALTEFPIAIYSLADTLEILDLSNNQLSHLPADFVRLQQLKIVFFSNNLFTVFPEVLAQCGNITMIGFKNNQIAFISENALPTTTRWLTLTNNKLTALPTTIGNCLRLEKLLLAGNLLEALPSSLANCNNLALLRISANQLPVLPPWLLTMPQLSWLAFSSNPFSKMLMYNIPLPTINWQQLLLTEQLGEGASGIIYKAIWQKDNSQQEGVAVKVFKGTVTSDGYPEDEMAACIAAGHHANLVQVLGKINNHPSQKQGLVLGLIPTAFYNLGMPPSFDTCTRDVFTANTHFSTAQILAIAKAIASVGAHLHSKGIMHGDMYAHNTLVNAQHATIFGDFGAASLYDITTIQAASLERIEVRAFGCLLDDLLQHNNNNTSNTTKFLNALVEACLQPLVLLRPSFNAIVNALNNLTIL